ncbi:unnamed protein product, partial [Oppiella nova]
TRNVLIISFYSLIVVVSLCGNLLVCKIAFTKRKMRTTTNILIASLACSDIVMTAFNIPFNIARLLLSDWPFGSVLCILVPLIQTSCVYVSTFTMTFISLHRWRTISKRSLFRKFSPIRLFAIIAVIWGLAIIVSLPLAIFNRIKEVTFQSQTVIRCRPQYPNFGFNYPLFLSVEVLVTQYVVPLTITCIVYVKIGLVVVQQGKLAGMSNDDRKRRQVEAKRRRIVMLALAVIVFAVCCTLVYDIDTSLTDIAVYIGNTTSPTTAPVASPTPPEVQTTRNVLIISFYSLIVVVSLCGNLLVCKIAFTKRKMRTTTNILIASLACSDIVMTAFNIPFNIARLLLSDWPFGSILCILVPLIQTSCVYVSTFTMTFISLHRWRTISKRSLFRKFSPIRLFVIIAVIWALAIIVSLPLAIFNRIQEVTFQSKTVIRCRSQYPNFGFNYRLFSSVEVLFTQYVVPLTITCIMYVKIGLVVVQQGKLAGMSNDDRKRRQIEAKRRDRLALVVIVFAVCWYVLYCLPFSGRGEFT